LFATAFEPILHGRNGNPQSVGYLVASQPFDLTEHDHFTKLNGQTSQFFIQNLTQLVDGDPTGGIANSGLHSGWILPGSLRLNITASQPHGP